MSKWRLLDLETVGHPDAGKWLEPLTAPTNYKDPLKIEAYIAEATLERTEKLGLDLDCNRIVALGFHDVGYGDPTVLLCADEFEEKEALRTFWASYVKAPTRLVTYNGIRFDLPTLIMQSLFLGVTHPPLVIAPAWKTDHVDLWERLSLGGARRDVKSQRFYLRRFGIDIDDPITGADIGRLVAENTPESWQAIHDHCLADIGGLHALANKLGVLDLVAA